MVVDTTTNMMIEQHQIFGIGKEVGPTKAEVTTGIEGTVSVETNLEPLVALGQGPGWRILMVT